MVRRIPSLQSNTDPFANFWRIMLKILGIFALISGLALWGREIRLGQTLQATSGSIIDAREIGNGNQARYAPVVEFSPQDGRVVHFQGSSTSQKPKQGTTVTVLYNISRPEEARIDNFQERWLVPALLTPIGFLLLVGVAWWRKYPNPS